MDDDEIFGVDVTPSHNSTNIYASNDLITQNNDNQASNNNNANGSSNSNSNGLDFDWNNNSQQVSPTIQPV